MTKISPPNSKLSLSAQETAQYLATALGGDMARWTIWLANDRKPTRVKRQLPQVGGPGRPRYEAAMVEAFVANYPKELGKADQAVARERVTKSRRFAAHISASTFEGGAEASSVLFVIANPLVAFTLSVEEARQTAHRLNAAADAIEAASAI